MGDSAAYDREDRRAAILNAAQEVFAEYGFHRAKVETIAERASIAKGTIYLYFPSKTELLRALVEERMGRLIRMVDDQIAQRCDPMAMIQGIISAHFLFYFEEREFIAILYGQLGQIAEGMEGPAKRGWERMSELISNVLQHGIQEGQLRPVCPHTLTQSLQGMIHAVAFEWIVMNGDKTPDELSQEVYQLFRSGALAPAAMTH